MVYGFRSAQPTGVLGGFGALKPVVVVVFSGFLTVACSKGGGAPAGGGGKGPLPFAGAGEESTNTTPLLTSISPASGPTTGGTRVTIRGSRFRAGATVKINGVACTAVTVLSSSQLECTAPSNPLGAKSVAVINPGGKQGTRAAFFTYEVAIPPVAGHAFVSGGGVLTGTGITLRATLGEVASPARQTDPDDTYQKISGIQGVYFGTE